MTTPGFDTHNPAMRVFTLPRSLTSYWSWSILSVVLLTMTPSLHAFPCWTKFSKADFPNCQQLTKSYSIHWRIASGNVTFGIALNATASWVGLGISEAGGAPTPRSGPAFNYMRNCLRSTYITFSSCFAEWSFLKRNNKRHCRMRCVFDVPRIENSSDRVVFTHKQTTAATVSGLVLLSTAPDDRTFQA
jgi:hypothetical protein